LSDAAALPAGSGAFDLGAYLSQDALGARARYLHRLSEHWSGYAEAHLERGIGGMTRYGAQAGLRARW